jgi:negative regulator of flagellin synthesis FlgM
LHPGTRIAALTTDAETVKLNINPGRFGAVDPVNFALSHPSNSTGLRHSIGVVVLVEVSVPTGSNLTMQIYGPYRVSTTQPNSPPQRSQPQKADEAGAKPTATPVDQLDLSSGSASVNRLGASQVAGGGEIRINRVADIRRQISDGNYETPEKLDAALNRILDRLA